MAKVVLYGTIVSSPVRAVLLTLRTVDIPYEFQVVDVAKGEILSEEFLKHNPQHTIPLLNDNGTWIWDSHAICAYLAAKYGRNDDLYPKDLAKRAVVDQRMFFDVSILGMAMKAVSRSLTLDGSNIIVREKSQNILEGYNFLEKFLENSLYVCGDTLTVADFCCVASITSLSGIIEIDPAKYPKITAWIERLKELPYYQKTNGDGVQLLHSKLKPILGQVIF